MIDILGLMEPIAILVASFLLYIFFFQLNNKIQSGFYKNPDWNFVFKRWYAERELNKIKLMTRNKLKLKLTKNLSERPLLLKNESSSDMILFYGTDQNGNSILLRMTRLRHRTADLWIMIRLGNDSDKKCFTLPEHPLTRVYEVKTGKFKAGGLEFECLEPFVRWRITYNGYLRENIRNEVNNDINENELKFVKFNFFFNASNQPLFWPLDWSSNLMASGLATENWKDGDWPSVLNIPGNGGYDQYGELHGKIFLPDKKIQEFRLPGLRQRRWEAFQYYNIRRMVSVFGVCDQGCIFNIGAISYHTSLSHVQFGNVRFANDEVHPIVWTDFKIPNVAEQLDEIPQHTVIQFKAGGRSFKAFLSLQHNKAMKLVKGSPYKWRVVNIPSKIDLNMTLGCGILTAWFPYSFTEIEKIVNEPIKYKKLVFNYSLPDQNKLVLSFNEHEAQSKLVAGGKGASLALLTSAKDDFKNSITFEIPKGFILSSSALRKFLLLNPDVYSELKNLEDICSARSNESFAKACDRIQQSFETTILEREIGIAIRHALETMKIDEKNDIFAIRSSGVDEDGKDFSSAGQNETILGVKGFENVLEGIKKCWASLYSQRSVQYRKTHAQPIIAEMAVVVQIMVPSQFSGVLFTKHSIPEHSSEILITANYGLGETVVSGAVEPDTFIVTKNYDSTKFIVKQTVIGEKRYSLFLKNSGGTEKVENINENKIACLSDEMIVKLSEIGVILEKMYGDPQDIEWAIYDENIYLLQSRPITTLRQFSDWEYLHEFDTPLMSTNLLLTRGNVGEVFVGAIDNLTSSTVIKMLNMVWVRNKNDFFQNLSNFKGIKMEYQQVFMDLLIFFKGFKPGNVSINEKVQAFGILGSLELTPNMKIACYNRNGSLNWNDYVEMYSMLLSPLNAGKKLKQFENSINYFRLINVNDKIKSLKTAKELLLDINILIERNLIEAEEFHMFLSTANSVLQSICLGVLLDGENDFRTDHISDLMKVMNSSNDVISADIPKKINEIANTIFLQADYIQFKELEVEKVPSWLEENCPVAFRQYNQFLRTFGHRCLNEFCLSSTPWENDTKFIIKMIQDNLKQVNLSQGHVHYETKTDLVIEDLVTPKKTISKKILKFLIPYCRTSVQRREQSKNLLIYFINVLRKYFKRLSELMQMEGILPEKDLIYFLTHYELQQLILYEKTGLIQKAIRRRKLYESWNEIKFSDVIFGELKPCDLNKKNNFKFDSGSKIKGLPAQNGVIEGRACVLNDISQINQIKNGDILITHSTDIAWSPIFPILGGLVTELGGLISHGAVVAREYGLPCIIGARNATNFFKTDDKIYLDADNGFVTKL